MMRAPLPSLAAGIFLFVLAISPRVRAAEPQNSTKPTFWVIPHTHWEGAVFKTREEYLQMGLPNILTAVRLAQGTS